MSDWEVSQFYMCDKSPSPINYRFIPSIPTGSAHDQIYNMQKFGHISILWYPRPKGFIMNLIA
jgi:hypothetical protein